jgi:hypothetical protein
MVLCDVGAATNGLVDDRFARRSNGEYAVSGQRTCRTAFAAVFGISKRKVVTIGWIVLGSFTIKVAGMSTVNLLTENAPALSNVIVGVDVSM